MGGSASACLQEPGRLFSSYRPRHLGPPVPLPLHLGAAPQSPCSDLSFMRDPMSSSSEVWPQSRQSAEGPAWLTCVCLFCPPGKGPCRAGCGGAGGRRLWRREGPSRPRPRELGEGPKALVREPGASVGGAVGGRCPARRHWTGAEPPSSPCHGERT